MLDLIAVRMFSRETSSACTWRRLRRPVPISVIQSEVRVAKNPGPFYSSRRTFPVRIHFLPNIATIGEKNVSRETSRASFSPVIEKLWIFGRVILLFVAGDG